MSNLVKINCFQCNNTFERKISEVNRNNRQNRKNFCSQTCLNLNRNQKIEVKCHQCNKLFSKSKSQLSNNNFCSRSCSSTYNNTKRPKLLLSKQCKTCETSIYSNKTYCKNCWENRNNLTLKQLKYNSSIPNNAYGSIRARARNIANKLGWNKCIKCGYDKHVEIAHVKPITKFDEDTPVSIINDPSNLLALCPNCHWEFDHHIK